ncbi:MAG: carboxyl transferase domain-containing protein [Clostridia bacterium]
MDIISRLKDNSAKLTEATKSVRAFIEGIVDKKSFVETDAFAAGLGFLDGTEAQGEGVLTGYATLADMPVYIFVQNFEVMKGSMSIAQANKIEKCIKMAIKTGTPFISVIDSAGARLGEGVGVLEGYAKLIKAASEMKGNIPHIAVIKGSSVGLMSAYAGLADIVLIDGKDGMISLSSPNVVAAKSDEKLPTKDLFGALNSCRNGVSTLAYSGISDLKTKLCEIFGILSGNLPSEDDANRATKTLNNEVSLESLLKATCDNGDYISLNNESAKEVVTALARINGISVGIVATDGSLDGGKLGFKAYKKIKTFTNLLDNFQIPLVSLVDSLGAKPCLKCEQDGVTTNASEAFLSIALSQIPKISVIYGNAIGLSYALLASKGIGFDYVVAFPGASVAPLTADTAVNFLYLDEIGASKNPIQSREKLVSSYTEREGNPFIAAKDGFIDNIIEPSQVRPYLASILAMLEG